MLLTQGEARRASADLRLATVLASVAGALNTAGFEAVGYFSANMTGNVSALSEHIAFHDIASASFFVGVLATFVLGAACCTLIVNEGHRQRFSAVYAWSVLTESILLAALGAGDVAFPNFHTGAAFIFGLAFLMGLQNAVVTRISDARVRTTHVSGMMTDIGIELAHLYDYHFRRLYSKNEAGRDWSKLRLHLQTVGAFLVGGVVGAATYRAFGGMLLLGCSAILALAAAPSILRSRSADSAART